MAALFALARKANVEAKRDAMFNGDVINETEQRSVYHVALRAPKGSSPMLANGEDQVAKVNGVLDRIEDFSDRVRSGAWKGATGEALTTVLAIGIGGSYLGPEFLCEALRAEPAAAAAAAGRDLKSPDARPKTLVVIVSKSFTTAETIMNAKTVKNWLLANVKGDADAVVRQHVAAVSTQLDLTAQFGIAPENVFEFGDYVGGRFSVHSPSNLPVILGLLGLYNSSFLGYECKAILPYAQALLRFAAHVQQLDMESNGKSVAMDGSKLDFAAGEVIFGEPGTNGQHSFYQLMHQGRVVPAEFIGFAKSQAPVHLDGAPLSNHDELMCNFFAQPDALACGSASKMPCFSAFSSSELMAPTKRSPRIQRVIPGSACTTGTSQCARSLAWAARSVVISSEQPGVVPDEARRDPIGAAPVAPTSMEHDGLWGSLFTSSPSRQRPSAHAATLSASASESVMPDPEPRPRTDT
ncbi:glucose-6-phosphate isomerase [Aureococcus anophagefferens]|nr:glucose-6-phosphate isomerase [Aureococcus anophagefferens]